ARTTDRFDDPRDLGIVDVTDPREEMMLDLEVEAPEVPSEQPVLTREVDGRVHLVLGPSVRDLTGAGGHVRKDGLLEAVSELEHNRQDQADQKRHRAVEEQD